jgi:hypothetical protein
MIGIDPGIHNGLAVKYSNSNLYLTYTLTFWELIDKVDRIINQKNKAKIFIENPNLNPPLFFDQKNLRGRSNQYISKVAQNVGMNKAIARMIIERYKDNPNCTVTEIKPSKSSGTKLPLAKVERYVKMNGSKSEHARDAVMLIAGR